MIATLMTDASHCPNTGAGSFGFWCVSNRGRLAGGKPLAGEIKDSYEAEAKGVANSLVIGFRAGIIQEGDKVVIQLDNLAFVAGLNGKQRKPRSDIKSVIDFINNFCVEKNISIDCRHVKGHSKKNANRFKANNHCDKRAKEQLNIARNNLKVNK